MTRVGIELSPDACRIVEIDPAPAFERRRGQTRVRSFAVLPPSGPETDAKLRSLRNRRVAVVVWNAASDHRRVIVSRGSYESMRAEAIAALDAAGVQTRGAWIDVVPPKRTADRATSRPVVVALASGSELTTALQPLLTAGIRVQAVMTPAAALCSLARLRRESWTPNALEVFVALEERATCIALMRGGALVASRDLEWGYVDEFGSGFELRGREDLVTRLVDAISDFNGATGGAPGEIKNVCVCGGHPELRSMTAPLMEQLDIEFEPLDSLFGIDAARLPEPADEFRERGAELRLAWAAAADSPPTINLLRARSRRVSKTMLAHAAIVAGVAAGLVIGWRVQSLQWWRTTTPATSTRSARAPDAPEARRPTAAPVVAAGTAAPAATPPVVANKMPPVLLPSAPVAPNKTPSVVMSPPVVVAKVPRVVPSPPVVASKPPPVVLPPQPAARIEPRPTSMAARPPAAPPSRDTAAPIGQEPVQLPCEAHAGAGSCAAVRCSARHDSVFPGSQAGNHRWSHRRSGR